MRKALVVLLVALALLSAGCAAFVAGAGVGAGVAVYQAGKLHDTVSAPLPRVHAAVVAGMTDLGIQITLNRADKLTGKVHGQLASGKKVWVKLKSLNPTTTRITIRVGLTGDKDFSMRILKAARAHI